ncbi:retinol dehydrogenase 12-like [Actinia tenebrosa]|uniref:Retinol dehydrogenase 12-like n=1 Tax=Actinia tenebrosa TaxID=6105 RepID=A0A6P8IWU3_ACTTE|nr:retinol dehydrogenase 12-like [Actinia tenebrosa]
MIRWIIVLIVIVCAVVLAETKGSTCNDHHPKCVRWAAKGECEKNPKWMLQHCRMSCGQCASANVHNLHKLAISQKEEAFKVFLGIFIVLVIGIGIKVIFYGETCPSDAKLKGKTVMITGANTGIGKETARDLAWRKARVILACRDVTKGLKAAAEIIESTGNENVEVKRLDLASFKSIRKFAKEINEEEEKIHILINNAGYLGPYKKTTDGLESNFQVNYLGHFLLTNLLLDKIKASSPSRIINVSSMQHKKGRINFDDLQGEKSYGQFTAYNQSKLAQVMFTKQLADKLEGTKVTVNALHPGVVSTDIMRNFRIYQMWVLRPIISVVSYLFFKTTIQGAQTTIYCAVAPELDDVSGCYFDNCREVPCGENATDEGVAKKLWEISETLCYNVNE